MGSIEDFEKFAKSVTEAKPPVFLLKWIVGGIILLIALFSSFYTIEAESVGVVLRFGKFIKTTEPGLHLKAPFGIDQVHKVPVKRILKEEFGFRTADAGRRTVYAGTSAETEQEKHMLTGDLNIASVEWAVQFNINDPYKFLFANREPIGALRDVSEAVMRSVVGDRLVDEVLTQGRAEVSIEVQRMMQEVLNYYDTGINIVTVKLQDVHPPDPVKPSFNEVNEARQEQEKLINNAWQMYNQEIPKAEGNALRTVAEAEGYAMDRVNRAKGDADKFIQIYKEYRNAPDVTRRRMYIETMDEILPQMEDIYVIDESQKNLVPILQMMQRGTGGGAE